MKRDWIRLSIKIKDYLTPKDRVTISLDIRDIDNWVDFANTILRYRDKYGMRFTNSEADMLVGLDQDLMTTKNIFIDIMFSDIEEDDYERVSVLAKKYGIDTSTIRHAIKQGRIKDVEAYKEGKAWFVSESAIKRIYA